MTDKIKRFLEFRKQFTGREWFELNQAIEVRMKEKADQLELDDFDMELVSERLQGSIE